MGSSELGKELYKSRPFTILLWQNTHLGHTHLVGCEGASLVRADDGGAAQGLHRGQTPDNGVLLGHTAGTKSQTGGDDSRQTLVFMKDT